MFWFASKSNEENPNLNLKRRSNHDIAPVGMSPGCRTTCLDTCPSLKMQDLFFLLQGDDAVVGLVCLFVCFFCLFDFGIFFNLFRSGFLLRQ